jgi:pyruvate carboxylase
MAKELEKMGAHILAIKDMAGLCKPYAAEKLVTVLRQETGLPVHFHTHDSSGMNAASILKAAEAGVDVADAAVASMSGGLSQPNLNNLAAALRNTARDPGLDPEALYAASEYWETVRSYYAPFDTGPRYGLADLYLHEMPGGQYTNLREQAEAMGLGPRWGEVARTYGEVNQLFGDIVKVTPSSKVVGDMAIFLVSHGVSVAELGKLGPEHSLTLPNSVVEMFEGSLGIPEGGWPEQVQQAVLKGRKPMEGRPGAHLPAVDLEEAGQQAEKRTGAKPARTDLMSYLMYPEVYVKFDKARAAYGELDVLPSPQFFYGMEKGDEVTVELEPGKTLYLKFLTVSEPHPDGTRTVFFELNGQPREVTIRDQSLKSTAPERIKADPAVPGQIGAPIPGVVVSIFAEPGQTVKEGEKLLVIEAMKMQTTVASPLSGKVKQRLIQAGEKVDTKDLLLVLEAEA